MGRRDPRRRRPVRGWLLRGRLEPAAQRRRLPVTGRVLAVVGPTGTGKSALALVVAQAVNGEIVNADSMQLYRGMDVGTAKLRPDERGGVPHHLLDIWHVTETADVARYQTLARSVIDGILAR